MAYEETALLGGWPLAREPGTTERPAPRIVLTLEAEPGRSALQPLWRGRGGGA